MEKTSFALWKRLETLYVTKSLANHLMLKQHLFTFYINEYELLGDQISQFITLLNGLKNVEVKIDNEDQAMVTNSNKKDTIGVNLADESTDDFLLVSTSNSSELTFEWILDSRCYFLMYPNREWFSITVQLKVELCAWETIHPVRMHDGKIRTLLDVRINIKSSGVKVFRGALILLKGKRTNSFYILESSTMTSEIERPLFTTESKSTYLEWRQLGHKREKGMTVSLKRGFLLDSVQDRPLVGFDKDGAMRFRVNVEIVRVV
ncbi:hypothetical protein J1N35_014235 [Gossypium stocksii]|uniref:Uncharacterized protein n=1 Tax=Gossypium stocksii TaxID=47602 RepID=A0A9D3VW09_9ROSI|nr:hypothetical protein J1N35_014235 [Gossypium stocksii]